MVLEVRGVVVVKDWVVMVRWLREVVRERGVFGCNEVGGMVGEVVGGCY